MMTIRPGAILSPWIACKLLVLLCPAEDAAGVEVVRFQPDGAAVSDSLGLYRGTLSSSKTMSSVTLCARFNMFFLHSRACFFMLEDTIAGKDNMLKGELWLDRVRPVIAGTYNFHILKRQLWAYRWYHLCFTYDSEVRQIKTYLDGELSIVQDYTVNDPVFGDKASIGQGKHVTESFSGDLTQVNVWDYALQGDRIRAMAKCEVELNGNYISWDEGWDLQNVLSYNLSADALCQQKKGPDYFWFPSVQEDTAQYLCKALGSRLPLPSSMDDNNFWISLASKGLPQCRRNLWTPLTDKDEEGVWKSYDGEVVLSVPWSPGEPNGLHYENCALLSVGGLDDVECTPKARCAVCSFYEQERFSLLGTCEKELPNIYFVAYQEDMGHLVFKSYGEYHIVREGGRWTWLSTVGNYTIARMEDTKLNYPMGRRWWQLEREVCHQDPGTRRLLLLTPCSPDQFTCDNALCIALEKRCDLKYDCQDRSDEFECEIVSFPKDYQRHLPPRSPTQKDESLPITLHMDIESMSVMTLDMTIDVTYELRMTWADNRLQYLNINDDEGLNKLPMSVIRDLWTPVVSFINAKGIKHTEVDTEAEMFVNRLSDANQRDEAAPAEVEVYYGYLNPLTIRRKYQTVYMCEFDLLMYPFDVQMCEMYLRITSGPKALLVFHENSSLQFLPSPFLLEYEVGEVTLQFDTTGTFSAVRVKVPLSRRYGYAILNIYIPSFILIVVSYVTLFFRASIFDVRIMAALTAQLVIATLFSQVSSSLPKTSYFKMVDVWLLFCIGITFFVIILHAFVDDKLYHDGRESAITAVQPIQGPAKSSPTSFHKFHAKERRLVVATRVIVLLIFFVFNVIYWGYILS